MGKRYKVLVTLLEDLHSGSGMGGAGIDAYQFRGRDRKPLIRRTHFKGLLREAAEELMELGAGSRSDMDELFGRSGERIARNLVLQSLRLIENGKEVIWSSSARKPFSRVPQEETLHTVEFIGAGAKFEGRIELRNPSEKSDKLLKDCIRMTDRLGSRRQRGNGLVTIHIEEIQDHQEDPIAKPTDHHIRLRLLLRNLDPLIMSITGAPGNITPSECYIRGSQLLSAFVAWKIQAMNDDGWLYDKRIMISNAYPLPHLKDIQGLRLEDLDVIPMPLHILTRQIPDGKRDLQWPHWAESNNLVKPLHKEVKRDDQNGNEIKSIRSRFEEQSDEEKKIEGKEKKPHDREFLYRSGEGAWIRYKSELGLYLRNDAGAFRIRHRESENDTITDEEMSPNLFSQEGIVEDTCFIADIQFTDLIAAKKFMNDFQPLLEKRSWLTIGRGGSPVEVENFQWCGNHERRTSNRHNEKSMTLFLESDLILRSETLGFYDELSHSAILHAIQSDDAYQIDEIPYQKYAVQVNTLKGFNGASGLMSPTVQVFRRGSIVEITGTDIQALRERFKSLAALGERTREGFGRFRIDFDPLKEEGGAVPESTQLVMESEDAGKSESIYEAALVMARNLEQCKKAKDRKDWPSKTQWNDLYQKISQKTTPQEINEHLSTLQTDSKLGAAIWKNVDLKSMQADMNRLRERWGCGGDENNKDAVEIMSTYLRVLIRKQLLTFRKDSDHE